MYLSDFLHINFFDLVIIILFSLLVGTIMFYVIKSLKPKSYNEQLSKAEFDSMRMMYESRMYDLNHLIMKNEQRWQDINHLVINSTKNTIVADSDLIYSDFFKANGVKESDLIVDEKFVFVLTPFHDRYADDYYAIRNLCLNTGFTCSRGDEEFHASDIFSHVLKQIVKAKVIIVNLNGRNPNVLYELGIAQAIGKPVILLSKTVYDLPADIKSKRFIIYETYDQLRDLLKDELIKLYVK